MTFYFKQTLIFHAQKICTKIISKLQCDSNVALPINVSTCRYIFLFAVGNT